jgi:succinoglycan biosynthesis protein ExoM
MTNVSICICTRKRQDELKRLLDSIENINVPNDIKIKVVIVENDLEKCSENIVKKFSLKSKFSINYFLEPNQGLSFARNRSIKEAGEYDFCCFTDDDQIVDSNWLIELLNCQKEFNADGVSGSTPPIFLKKVPVYIHNYHTRKIFSYGTIIEAANTGCLLLRKEYLDLIDGPFDKRLNFTGGEDVYLTYLITNMGGVIRYNPNAIAFEIIPENRTTIKYVIKRTYRIANSRLVIRSLKGNKFYKVRALPKLILRFCYGLLIFIPFLIFGKANKLRGLIGIVGALGGFSFILGVHNKFYK